MTSIQVRSDIADIDNECSGYGMLDEAVMSYLKKFVFKIEGNPDKSCSRHRITLW